MPDLGLTQAEKDAIDEALEVQIAADKARENKAELENLTLEINGTLYQANATSQGRILAKIVAMERRNETVCTWRDANNNNIQTTLTELIALADAIEAKLEELILM